MEAARIVAVLACCLLLPTPTQGPTPACAQEPQTSIAPPARLPAGQMLSAPAAEAGEEVLPVNLPAALRLANAQAWDIALAVHRLRIASAQLEGARVLWLPNLTGGVDYLHHDGPVVSTTTGAVVPDSSYGSLYAGVAPLAVVALTDALFTPLAQRQVTCAQIANVQTATNDTLTSLAVAYFDTVEARACLASIDDVVQRLKQLVHKTESLAPELVPDLEVARVRAALASAEEVREVARRNWRNASAEVVRVVRLKPAVLVTPLESPQLQVTLISTERTPEELIPLALRSRPELTYREAQVEAACHRLRQERCRPFLPIFLARGDGTQVPYPMAFGAFSGGPGGTLSNFNVRSDFDLQAIWQLNNLGLGNRALIQQRVAERELARIEACKARDVVAMEVTQTWADLRSASRRVRQAERELQQALISAAKNLEALGETKRVAGNIRILVIRPLEAVVALQALNEAYYHYFGAVADYNRAEFELYRALGNPAQGLSDDLQSVTSSAPVAGQPAVVPEKLPLPPASAAVPADPHQSESRP
ncbi:MAG: TolC family protein [Thermoguttaceae bacterium]